MKNAANYKSYGEIHLQNSALEQTLALVRENREAIRAFFAPCREVVFLASGSSYWLSLSAHLSFRVKTGRRTCALKAGDVLLSPGEHAGQFDAPVFVCPSRSGRTSEVLRALEALKGMYPGARVLAMVEYPGSPLEQVADLALFLPWGNEESVCQTRSFSSLYLASVAMAAVVGEDDAFMAAATRYLKAAPELYRRHEADIAALLDAGTPASIVCLGSGRQYGVCIEGAYIVIEMAQFNTNYYQLLEYRHGPIVTAGAGTLVFILSAPGCEEHERGLARQVAAAGARVCVVAGQAPGYGSTAFLLQGEYPHELVALHYVFCLQSLAFQLSLRLGNNPDSPGNLIPYIEL